MDDDARDGVDEGPGRKCRLIGDEVAAAESATVQGPPPKKHLKLQKIHILPYIFNLFFTFQKSSTN